MFLTKQRFAQGWRPRFYATQCREEKRMNLSLETTLGIAESINSYLIQAIQIGRSSATVQGFLASVDAEDPNPYRNYAVPFAGTHPSSHDVFGTSPMVL